MEVDTPAIIDWLSVTLHSAFRFMRYCVNGFCEHLEPWQIILCTGLLSYALSVVYKFFYIGDDPVKKIKQFVFKAVRSIPYVRRQIEAEVQKTAGRMEDEFASSLSPGMTYVKRLPINGLSQEEIVSVAQEYKAMGHCNLYQGRASGTLYNGEKSITQLCVKMYEMFAWSNPLHADLFPDIRKMEAEVVQMCVNMFNGGPEACGTMTLGGTESIMLACKAYRDLAISRGVTQPEMLIPRTAHAAFEKACQTFSIKLRLVPQDPVTMRADVKAMARMINRNTCMLAGSCPDFAMGAIDPIEEIGKLGEKYNIPVHVDACLGGFLVAFMEQAGFPLPLFDFRVPGVTSISCDTHKYAFAPKGSSVILYRNKSIRRYQFFVITDWPGGIYATPTLSGSRPGAIIAACWASLMYFGESGYVSSTKKIINTARYIIRSLRDIPGLFVFGEPLVSVITVGSLDFDIYRLSSALLEKGWSLNALQFPSSFHLCVTLVHTKPGIADQFLADVRECTAKIMLNPKLKTSGMAAIYGMSQQIPDRSLVNELIMEYMDAFYNTDLLPRAVHNGIHH